MREEGESRDRAMTLELDDGIKIPRSHNHICPSCQLRLGPFSPSFL